MIKASEVKTELAELLANLEWASRITPTSPSNTRLRLLINRPSILDLLERLVRAEWERQQ